MKRVVPLLAALASSLIPSLALACPYAGGCASCSPSGLGQYGAWLVLGLGMGIASVAFERKRH